MTDIQSLLSRIPTDYTKGPWKGGPGYVTLPDGRIIDVTDDYDDDSTCPRCFRDAALIALAPELAEAVREMADMYSIEHDLRVAGVRSARAEQEELRTRIATLEAENEALRPMEAHHEP